jgi:4-hydroxy-2-oxoheptanedioate aldolase
MAHRQADFGRAGLAGYLAGQAHDPPMLVAQIETAETDDPLSEITAAGPDVIFIGTTDLAVDLGLDAAEVRERIEEITTAAVTAGIALGAFALDDPRITYEIRSSDLALLREAMEP